MKKFSKEELYELYITQNKSKKEVAEILHTNETTLGSYFKKYGIKKAKFGVLAQKNICGQNRKKIIKTNNVAQAAFLYDKSY